jgi:hypothetical protein
VQEAIAEVERLMAQYERASDDPPPGRTVKYVDRSR